MTFQKLSKSTSVAARAAEVRVAPRDVKAAASVGVSKLHLGSIIKSSIPAADVPRTACDAFRNSCF